MSTSLVTAEPTAAPVVELSVGGMTCASCAGRVERALNRLDGVSASVNYATERALVSGLAPERADAAVAAVRKAGYDAAVRVDGDDEWSRRAALERIGSLRRRLLLAALLAFPLMDLTLVLALVPRLRFPGWELLCVALAIPVVVWAAWPFHRATLRNLRHGSVTMDTLVSLGIAVSFGWAVATLFFGEDAGGYWIGYGMTPAGASSIYLDVAAGMTTFQLAGRYFETRSRRRAGDVLDGLARLAPDRARVVRDGVETVVPTATVRVGELVVVRAGETVPVDGTVVDGRAGVDTSSLTGEPLPRDTGPGDDIVTGTISRDGRVVVRSTAVGAHTRLAQLTAMAEQAQSSKARVQALVDRIVRWFVPAVIAAAIVVTAAWLVGGASVGHAIGVGIAVLIIACPCALGLATPTALMVGVGRGAQLGILIKGQAALEASGRIDTIVLDKTGTVTLSTPRVTGVEVAPGEDRVAVLRLAAAIEAGSEHPIAAAITTAAAGRVTDLPEVRDYRTLPGRGAAGLVDGRAVSVGSAGLLDDLCITVPAWATDTVETAEHDGRTVVFLVRDDEVIALFCIADDVHPSAKDALVRLTRMGLHPVLLTGDSTAAARRVAGELGIDDVRAEVLPDEKADVIAALRGQGHRVAMVGDGINDAAALGTADLGMAIATGTDIAIRSADIILVRDDLTVIADALALAQRTLRTIHGNLGWAFAYNVAAIPIAAAGLLNPLISAAAMSLSSVLVVWNSLRLRSARLHR
ncbi:heavy metal translocating P-type ATPase [Microbacterium horticulturae]|uniref:Heavy metal translocating P-type ATPase n=1 Tax=Microbacterium horticulturae TaxID=3028316 RepID=A0ABY8C0A4_9MICO|nr:heavy metal translocating P-type ATPase [Microbacterium sp. KACC 23027]WEG08655.1 heavy metal translocating P-type ATPase [Microbacterium sp. KACC 23027]